MKTILLPIALVLIIGASLPGQKPGDSDLKARVEAIKAFLEEKGSRYPAWGRVLLEALAQDGKNRIPILRALLEDNRGIIRLPAIEALGSLGSEAVAAVPDLVGLLGDRTLTERRVIRGTVGHVFNPMLFDGKRFRGKLPEAIRRMGRPAMPALVRALDREEHVRIRALQILEAFGPDAEAALPALKTRLEEESSEAVRIRIINVLGAVGEGARAFAPALKAIFRIRKTYLYSLPPSNDTPQRAAARALVYIDRAFMNATLDSPDPMDRHLATRALSGWFPGGLFHSNEWLILKRRTRTRALEAVGLSPDADTFAFLEALRSKNENVRAVALTSLPDRMLQDQRAQLQRLTPYLSDENPWVRRGAVTCLAAFNERERGPASRLAGSRLEDPDVKVRRAAFRVLQRMDARLHLPAIKAAVKDPDDQIAAEAVQLLARLARRQRTAADIEVFLEAAGSNRAELIRVQALKALGTYSRSHAKAVPVLIRALADPSPEIRKTALLTLMAFQDHAGKAIPRGKELLSDENPAVRLAAAYFLGGQGQRALDAEADMLRLLKDPDPEVRRWIKGALHGFSTLKKKFEAVQNGFKSNDPKVRRKAVYRSREFGDRFRSSLLSALADEDLLVRRGAAQQLLESEDLDSLAEVFRKTRSWRVWAALLEGLRFKTQSPPYPDPRHEKQAARIRLLIQTLKAEIFKALEDEQVEVRRAAVRLVGNLARDLDAVKYLFRALKDGDKEVRDSAQYSLSRLGEPKLDLSGLIRTLEDPEKDPRLILRKLNRMGEKAAAALPALRAGLKRARGEVRGYFALTLGNVGRGRAAQDVPDILALLEDENPRIRSQAAYGLGYIGPPARVSMQKLVHLFEKDTKPFVRYAAVQALGGVTRGTDEAVPLLIRALSDSYLPCRQIAARTLGELGPVARDAVPALEALEQKGNASFRQVATEALKKILAEPATNEASRTRCVSRPPDSSTTLYGHCWYPTISGNGRFVAFDSDAAGLLEKTSGPRLPRKATRQVYLFDCTEGTLSRVSINSEGMPGNAESKRPALSEDGRIVAFVSKADNLVPGDHNQRPDVFVHDRKTGKTTRVSVSSTGAQASEGSWWPSLSADGRVVVFQSKADNLVEDDHNHQPDIFVHDRKTGKTTRISVRSDGKEADGGSHFPMVSADGLRVVFTSHAKNLDPERPDKRFGIFLHDRKTRKTRWVAEGDSPAISGNGRYLAFRRSKRDRRALQPESDGLYLHDLESGKTMELFFTPDPGRQVDRGFPSLSKDGRFTAFSSRYKTLVQADTNDHEDIFVYDRTRKKYHRASVSASGRQAKNSSHTCALSTDGRVVAFISFADNLVDGDRNGCPDIFIRRLE